MIGKAQTQSSHLLTPSPPTPPRAKHIHILHNSPIPLSHITSAELDTIPEPHIPPTFHALTTTTPHPSPTRVLPSPSHPHTLSAYTHATQPTVPESQSQQPPHQYRVPRQPHKQTKDDPITTDTPHGHRPSSRSEIIFIILQVNINGIKNKLEELKLLIQDMHMSLQFRKPSSPLKQTHPKYITLPPCVPIGRTRQEVGSLHSLETTLHSLQQTYLRPSIHTT